jgi:alpha-D-ribose 1-methylphosphonate 5-triphosphate diphosphatase
LADAGDVLLSDYSPATLIEAVLLLPELISMPLHRAVRLATANPARAMGLVDRGVIEVGRRADLVAVRRDQPPALVEATMVGGRIVHVSDPSGRMFARLSATL